MTDEKLKEYLKKHNTELFKGQNKFVLELYAEIIKKLEGKK